MLQARMGITLLSLSTPHRLCTLLKGNHTLLLIHISTKVSFTQHACFSSRRERTAVVQAFVMFLRCCSEPCDHPGAAARGCRRRGSGHARWSSYWFGSGISLLSLLSYDQSARVHLRYYKHFGCLSTFLSCLNMNSLHNLVSKTCLCTL